MTGEAIVARARGLVGVRFRLQGRSAEWGVDCIGLAALALGIEDAPFAYARRGGAVEEVERELVRLGLVRVERPGPGDLLVMAAGARQLHLGILTERGMVHADAGLRRVVERPGRAPFPLLSAWRVEG